MRALTTTATANLGRPMPPRLSIDQNRFTLVDSTGNEKMIQMLYLDVIFIDLNDNVSKMYWGKEYNPQITGDIPLCWSDNGVGPSVQASDPQSTTCAACPHNAWGSSVNQQTGKLGRACAAATRVSVGNAIPDPQWCACAGADSRRRGAPGAARRARSRDSRRDGESRLSSARLPLAAALLAALARVTTQLPPFVILELHLCFCRARFAPR
jgi:hypothetical protein